MTLLVKTGVTKPICMAEDGKNNKDFLAMCLEADIAPCLVPGITFLREHMPNID